MRILITGGAGFIGSHLAERLLRQGHQVVTWDRKLEQPNLDSELFDSYWNAALLTKARVDCRLFRYGGEELYDYLEGVEFIYHLASTVGVKRVLENPSECISNNLDSLRAVLGLGIPGLFTSTSEVYGKSENALREDAPLLYSSAKRWSYAASKLLGEWMALQTGWKVVRLFNVVGPRQSTEYGAVLPNFVKQALAGEPLTVYGSGEQVRTFIDVRDCAEVLDKLREKAFDVVNVGGTNVMSVENLALTVASALSLARVRMSKQPYSGAYPEGFDECISRIPDLTKLDSLLPERPNTDFRKTIRDLAEDINSKRGNEKCLVQTT